MTAIPERILHRWMIEYLLCGKSECVPLDVFPGIPFSDRATTRFIAAAIEKAIQDLEAATQAIAALQSSNDRLSQLHLDAIEKLVARAELANKPNQNAKRNQG